MSMEATKDNILWIDYAKFIGIFLVIIVHSGIECNIFDFIQLFFRIEKIFTNYFFNENFKQQTNQYINMRKVYFSQLISIYHREIANFNFLNKSSK